MKKYPKELVQSGPYKGYRIRTARKAGKCDAHWRGCQTQIKVGDRYVEGDASALVRGPVGIARERLCLKCGGVEK